jgi:hypothetical protein
MFWNTFVSYLALCGLVDTNLSTQQQSDRSQRIAILMLTARCDNLKPLIQLNTLVTSSGRSHIWPHGNGLRTRGSQSTHETYAYAEKLNLVTTMAGKPEVRVFGRK